jgi:protein-S-isoprenylcysteine O-methyltransferase Ste14
MLAVAVALHTIGVVTMIAADGQRHFILKNKSGLFTGGLYAYTRNPNYLGETMLYSAYALLAQHWLAWAIVGYAVFSTFLPRMYQKDYALSRHSGWVAYKAKTGLIIPWGMLNGRALFDRLSGKHALK